MKKLSLLSYSALVFTVLFGIGSSYSQQKYIERFNVADNVEVSVNTSFTNVVFETWNKNVVEVEAFIEGNNLSDNERQVLMKNWNLEITGNSNKVSISSNAGGQALAMNSMDFLGPLMEEMVMPMMQNFEMKPFPEDLLANIGAIQFDYDAFKKDEEGYIKKFEAEMDKNFGKDFEEKMEAWGESFEELWDEDRADSIGEAYGERMEEWAEAYSKRMEAWANTIEEKYENEGGNYSKTVTKTPNGTSIVIQGSRSSNATSGKTTKTIIIRMPKNTKTEINVRHGSIKMADVTNVRANLDYSSFSANSIDGGNTHISAAYAPVQVNIWKQGVLNVKYVDNCTIETVQNINLRANSSNVQIGNIAHQAFVSGSFGDLNIEKISEGFETLDIQLENTDATVNIPSGAFSFYFNGSKSTLKYPKMLQLKESKSGNRVLVKGYHINTNSNKTIAINATFSNVSLQ